MNAAEAAIAGIFGSKGNGGSGGQNFTFDSNGHFQYPENVVVPATVTSIVGANTAFMNHQEIKHISFEARSSSLSFGSDAFNGCTGLENIDLPTTGVALGNAMFRGCTSLKSITIPDGVTSLGNWMCTNCTALEMISLPTSVKSINNSNSFSGCTAVTNINIGKNWNFAANFSFTNILTHDSMVAMFENLADLTGQTAKTLTLGETNLARLSEEEKVIATSKNWVLA